MLGQPPDPGPEPAPSDRGASGMTPSIFKPVDGTDEDPPPPIQFAGGMGMTGVPPLYTHVLIRTLEALRRPEWEQWWLGADLGPLRLCFVNMPWKDGALYQVEKARGGIWGTVRRPLPTFPDDADFAQFARDDVAGLVAKVQKRGKLGPHPPIPDVEVDWDEVRAEESTNAATVSRLHREQAGDS